MSVDSQVVPLVIPATSNREFLEFLFGDQWSQVLVTSFSRDPSDTTKPREDWNAWPAGDVLANPNFDNGNTYFCPSLLVPGTRDRMIENFLSLHVIIIDDIPTKVKLVEVVNLLRIPPSYIIETSPRNHQAGWKIEPETDLAWVKGMLTQLDRALGGADNLTNPVAWRRLPVGRNTKAALVQQLGPQGFRVRVKPGYPGPMIRGLDWPTDIEPMIGEIMPLTTLDRGIGDGHRPDAQQLTSDPVYQALEEAGMILGEKITSDKHWAATIKCPWVANHGPTRPLTGAEYVPAIPSQRGWFHCFHCERRGQAEFKEQLDVVLRDEGQKIVAAFEFDEIDPKFLPTPDDAVRALASYEATEDGMAQAFAAKFEGQLRFDHVRGKWFRWTGGFWRQDEIQYAFRWARELARAYRKSMQDATAGQVKAIGKMQVAKAIETGARADGRLATDGLSWDQDPWLIGAPGCEIDLRTGLSSPPDPAHGITKQLLVAPRDIPTPLWDQFLWDSTGGDPEVISFLQAWSGYCLTGDISEEKFVFIYGPGGNGKGTYIYTTDAILHDYAERCAADMFMVRKHAVHTEEVARLAGVRSITASEIEDGQTFNAGRLKDFTGRDGKLTGAFKYRDTFAFMPQFKITFVGNTQPRMSNVDEAMRRRIILIPFTQTPVTVDITLKDRLVAEYPGILRWMIEGENRRRTMGGLAALLPATATQATSEYLDDQDTLKAWAGERCVFGFGDQMGVTKALEDYKLWCHRRGEQTEIGINEFGRKFVITFPACIKKHTMHGNVLVGVGLSQQDVMI